ncbi:MAG TPA: dihydropteroate synthase [Acidimicrobiia bacterium]|nr:dihydropteroate synthase [Acidimicrobiia bacterium]
MTRRWGTSRGELSLEAPLLMGIVNVTPDSFSDGGLLPTAESAIAHGRRLVSDGAALLDIGGESTRPRAEPVALEVELERILPVVEGLSASGALVSIDTTKADVARAALEAGAVIVNDISGGSDPDLVEAVAQFNAGLVLMHMQGTPQTMQDDPTYADVVTEVGDFLAQRTRMAMQLGVSPDHICVDPGIGFGKLAEHNLALLAGVSRLRKLGFPIMVGISRKAFLGRITGEKDPLRRDVATAAGVATLWDQGVDVFRVHNVAACREALLVAMAIVPPVDHRDETTQV